MAPAASGGSAKTQSLDDISGRDGASFDTGLTAAGAAIDVVSMLPNDEIDSTKSISKSEIGSSEPAAGGPMD